MVGKKGELSIGITLMILCAICLCSGQFIWKYTQKPFFLLVGFAVYGVGALAMLCAYSFGDLSTLQPINSVCYIVSAVLGATVFHEAITWTTIVGILCIMAGVFLLARGTEQK